MFVDISKKKYIINKLYDFKVLPICYNVIEKYLNDSFYISKISD